MKEAIREYIRKEFLFGKGTVQDDDLLFEKGIIDSLGFLKLLAFLDQELGVSIDMSDITMEQFRTLDEIAAFAEEKRGASGR
jgi:acyl carrier protein